MTRVGNDIVDLRLPENRGRSGDRRLLNRVFTLQERAAIARSARPDTLLWAFWAAKEAAFKAVSRDDPEVCSVPRRYAASLEEEMPPAESGRERTGTAPTSSLAGVVQTPCGELAVRITASDEWVHALAADSVASFDRFMVRIDGPDDPDHEGDPSEAVRRRVARWVAACSGCPVGAVEIRKDARGPGVPRLFVDNRELPIAISLSHDGRYTAFALDLPA